MYRERYKKCIKKCACKWKMNSNHSDGYQYLNDACYLSRSFDIDCPDKKIME